MAFSLCDTQGAVGFAHAAAAVRHDVARWQLTTIRRHIFVLKRRMIISISTSRIFNYEMRAKKVYINQGFMKGHALILRYTYTALEYDGFSQQMMCWFGALYASYY